jgi:hypothetical protein
MEEMAKGLRRRLGGQAVRRMGRFGNRGIRAAGTVALLVLAGACTEDLTAPQGGTCPDYCPPEHVTVVDSVLLDNILSDSAFRGYVRSWEATSLQTYRDSSAGGDAGSRVVYRFAAFSDSLLIAASDTTLGQVLGTDSFVVELPIVARHTEQTGLELVFHRVPAAVDSTVGYGDLDSSFADSTIIGVLSVPDSLTASSVFVRFDSAAFPSLAADGNTAALGVVLRTSSGYVQLGSVKGASAPSLTRYVRLDSAGTTVPRADGKVAVFNAVAATPLPVMDPNDRAAGGLPSIRTMLRFGLPARIMDSSTVLRATLLLIPTGPVLGAPGDTLALLAHGLTSDVGAKSPLEALSTDSLVARLSFYPVGWNDTLRLDVTTLVRAWAGDSTRPRALVVRSIPEGGSVAEVRFGSAASGPLRPRLLITFAPPITLGGR